MRFLVFACVGLAGLAGFVLVVGWLLPPEREGRAEAFITAPPERVLEVIADVETQTEWRDGIATVTRSAQGWVEVTKRGERIEFSPEEMGPERVRLRFRSDAGYSGEWQAVLAREGDGTRIAVIERSVVPAPLGRIIARLVFDPDAFATTYLAALKAACEG